MERRKPDAIRRATALRYMGAAGWSPDAATSALLDKAEKQILAIAVPHVVWRVLPLTVLPFENCGTDLARHLQGCDKALLMAATLGSEIDRFLRRLELTDIAAAAAADALASVLLEQVCDEWEAEQRPLFEEKGLYLTGRYAPGYGDCPLSLNDEICLAVSSMSKTRTGALIIFERKTKLNDMLTGGTDVNSDISSELIENIFVPNTPLHDGAVIIRNGRIFKAACVLPLSGNKNLSKEFGTRHRAALGISEQTDCVGLVVSEETGKVSVAVNGDMLRNLSISSLSRVLNKLVDKESENEKKNRAAKFFRGRERK